ncbi:MAG: transposase, partial [Campylobacterota bacterium]|nr:transposase [Campylobacterota bacterium]
MNQDNLLEDIYLELKELKEEVTSLKQEIKRLNEIINKDSSNSSKPPSTDNGFKDTDKKDSSSDPKDKKRKRGGQTGSKGSNLEKVNNPDSIEVLTVSSCKNCNHSLEDVDSSLISTKQLFDIPKINIEVTEFQLHSKTCPCCSSVNKAQYPSHLKATTQYGDNIKTFIAYLNTYQMLPYDRISELLEDFISHKISNGTIYNILNGISSKLEPFENNIKDLLLKSDVIHVDETGTRVKDKLHWTHTVS